MWKIKYTSISYTSNTNIILSLDSQPVCEVPIYRGGFPPFYVPSEDMYLWPSACGTVVLLRSVRGGSLGWGSQRAWSRGRYLHTHSSRGARLNPLWLFSPCFGRYIFKKGKHWLERIKVSKWFSCSMCAHVSSCVYVCACVVVRALCLSPCMCLFVSCFFRLGVVLALQGMPLKMGRATFNPHTASSETGITRCHIKSLSPFNPNPVTRSRDWDLALRKTFGTDTF